MLRDFAHYSSRPIDRDITEIIQELERASATNPIASRALELCGTIKDPCAVELVRKSCEAAYLLIAGGTTIQERIRLSSKFSEFERSYLTVPSRTEIVSESNVPYLAPISSLALSIFRAVQQCRSNKAELVALAERAAELVVDISDTCRTLLTESFKELATDQIHQNLSPLLERHMDKLYKTFKDIEAFAIEQKDCSRIIRFLRRNSDAEKIVEYRRKMDEAMSAFTMNSLIVIRHTLDRSL
ncbi:hypothetical protein VNI00_004482 [Paramarasmius palmivorus]|uniref:Uncharacterized protein n=1 Tax=Paramarasmius palmivorus TaxID=297713 RepID=A0AAW0DF97_9AGAR